MIELEALPGRDEEAKAAGVMLLPSVGYDVVPSDCLAAARGAAPALGHPPGPRLQLGGRPVARDDEIDDGHRGAAGHDAQGRQADAGARRRSSRAQFDFGQGPVECTSLPWGDVATAYYSTGIPNIETYMAMSAGDEAGAEERGRAEAVDREHAWASAC